MYIFERRNSYSRTSVTFSSGGFQNSGYCTVVTGSTRAAHGVESVHLTVITAITGNRGISTCRTVTSSAALTTCSLGWTSTIRHYKYKTEIARNSHMRRNIRLGFTVRKSVKSDSRSNSEHFDTTDLKIHSWNNEHHFNTVH